MRFLLVTDTYLPDVNGVTMSILRQANALKGCGHTVEIVGPKRCQVNRPVNSWSPFSTVDPMYRAEIPIQLSTIHNAVFTADRIHIHTPFGFGQAVAHFAKKLNKEIVYTHHTNFFDDYMHYLGILNIKPMRRFLLKFYRHFLSSITTIIVPTQSAALSLWKLCPDIAPATVVLPSPGFSFEPLCQPGDERDIDVIYVGRIAPEKNTKLAIDAIRVFCEREPRRNIAILGDGVQREFLEMSVRKLPYTKILFHGNVSNETVHKLLLKSKVMLFTSQSDTQALVIDEAAACGVPAVTVDSPLMRERIIPGKTGWVCSATPQTISEELSNALGCLNERGNNIRRACLESIRYSNLRDWAHDYLNIVRRKYE